MGSVLAVRLERPGPVGSVLAVRLERPAPVGSVLADTVEELLVGAWGGCGTHPGLRRPLGSLVSGRLGLVASGTCLPWLISLPLDW